MTKKKTAVHLTMKKEVPDLIEKKLICRCAWQIRGTAGRGQMARILKGSKDERILVYGLDTCSTYGSMKTCTLAEIEARIDAMIRSRYLRIAYSRKLPMIDLTAAGEKLAIPVLIEEWLEELQMYETTADLARLSELAKMIQSHRLDLRTALAHSVYEMDVLPKAFLSIWKAEETEQIRKTLAYLEEQRKEKEWKQLHLDRV